MVHLGAGTSEMLLHDRLTVFAASLTALPLLGFAAFVVPAKFRTDAIYRDFGSPGKPCLAIFCAMEHTHQIVAGPAFFPLDEYDRRFLEDNYAAGVLLWGGVSIEI